MEKLPLVFDSTWPRGLSLPSKTDVLSSPSSVLKVRLVKVRERLWTWLKETKRSLLCLPANPFLGGFCSTVTMSGYSCLCSRQTTVIVLEAARGARQGNRRKQKFKGNNNKCCRFFWVRTVVEHGVAHGEIVKLYKRFRSHQNQIVVI